MITIGHCGMQCNTWLVQSNPGAAHSFLRPLCLLPGFAAQPHVMPRRRRTSHSETQEGIEIADHEEY